MDTCSVRGDTVSQTIVLSFARINVIYLPELGGQLPPPDPPSRTPMAMGDVNILGDRLWNECLPRYIGLFPLVDVSHSQTGISHFLYG